MPAPVPKRAAKRAAKRDIDPLEHQPKPLWPLVVGCGCVLLLVTAVVVALILLIINLGSAIVSSAEHSPTLTEIDGGYPEPRSSPN